MLHHLFSLDDGNPGRSITIRYLRSQDEPLYTTPLTGTSLCFVPFFFRRTLTMVCLLLRSPLDCLGRVLRHEFPVLRCLLGCRLHFYCLMVVTNSLRSSSHLLCVSLEKARPPMLSSFFPFGPFLLTLSVLRVLRPPPPRNFIVRTDKMQMHLRASFGPEPFF